MPKRILKIRGSLKVTPSDPNTQEVVYVDAKTYRDEEKAKEKKAREGG